MEAVGEPISLSFSYTEREYTSALRECYRTFKHMWLAFVLPLVVTIIAVLGEIVFEDSTIWFLIGVLGVVLLMVQCVIYFSNPRAQFRKYAFLRSRVDMVIDDEGIKLSSKDAESKIKWSLFEKVVESDDFYLFSYYSSHRFMIIPKRAFHSDAEEARFRAFLGAHVDRRIQPGPLKSHSERAFDYVPKSLEPPDWR